MFSGSVFCVGIDWRAAIIVLHLRIGWPTRMYNYTTPGVGLAKSLFTYVIPMCPVLHSDHKKITRKRRSAF